MATSLLQAPLEFVTRALQTPVSTVLLWGGLVGAGVSLATWLLSQLLAPALKIGKETHVVVTGGSSGIGLAVAREYVLLGADVTLVARDPQRLAAAAAELQALAESTRADPAARSTVRVVSCDVSNSEYMLRGALDEAHVPDCDILINCAGTSIAGAFEELPSAAFEDMLRINVLGSVVPTRVLVGGMKRRGGGRIVFVSSQAGQCALHGYSAYSASKWALRGLAEALQMELRPFNIAVSVAYPPDTQTPGYALEMETKPTITRLLSEAGSVFKPQEVARDIVVYSRLGYFGISTGLDGWLLKQVHPGMTPVNNLWEVLQGVLFSGLCRLISVGYLAYFDSVVAGAVSAAAAAAGPAGSVAGGGSEGSEGESAGPVEGSRGQRASTRGNKDKDKDR